VLKEEEEHKERHRTGYCACEVVFDADERERRLRPRGKNGKGREKREFIRAQGQVRCRAEHGGLRELEEHKDRGMESHGQEGWEQRGEAVEYEYIGYRVGQSDVQYRHYVEQGYPHVVQGIHDQQHLGGRAQLTAGQPGVGMRWHPEGVSLTSMLPKKGFEVVMPFNKDSKAVVEVSKEGTSGSVSEHGHKSPEIPQQPMVVSSDMYLQVRPYSTTL